MWTLPRVPRKSVVDSHGLGMLCFGTSHQAERHGGIYAPHGDSPKDREAVDRKYREVLSFSQHRTPAPHEAPETGGGHGNGEGATVRPARQQGPGRSGIDSFIAPEALALPFRTTEHAREGGGIHSAVGYASCCLRTQQCAYISQTPLGVSGGPTETL